VKRRNSRRASTSGILLGVKRIQNLIIRVCTYGIPNPIKVQYSVCLKYIKSWRKGKGKGEGEGEGEGEVFDCLIKYKTTKTHPVLR
jgi:hypothetical protein